ncbi:MAG: endonuclease III [Dehalococcoidia bacterium]|nr:endonuclease III [Dehalococcoidia bacterium]
MGEEVCVVNAKARCYTSPVPETPAVTPLPPAEIVQRLDALYGVPPWRATHDPMTELVLTLLSQNTSDRNSGRAFIRLRERYPTWEQVLAADVKDVEDAIAIGGLAPTKAPRLKALLVEVAARRNGFNLSNLEDMPLEEAKAWLRELPGVGPKTAACVLMFALGRPALPVDTHVHRVAQRLGLIPPKMPPEQAHGVLEALVPPELTYAFHIALIKHGRRLCDARRPQCGDCPLLDGCPEGRRRLTG